MAKETIKNKAKAKASKVTEVVETTEEAVFTEGSALLEEQGDAVVETKKKKKEDIDELLTKVGTGEIIYVPISRLTLLESNPRLIGKSELTKLANSLEADKAYFETRPCLVNKVDDKLIVYAGNMRVRAALTLGWRLVPCLIDEIDAHNQDVRMFKDNMHAGEFNMKMLLKTFDVGFLQHDVGMNFTKAEITKFLKNGKNKQNEDGTDNEDYIDEGNLIGSAETDFEFETEEEDDNLYIASKFTNGTKPDALHFRQWEIPMSKGDAIWFTELLEDYRSKNKTLTNFWVWFRETIQDFEQ